MMYVLYTYRYINLSTFYDLWLYLLWVYMKLSRSVGIKYNLELTFCCLLLFTSRLKVSAHLAINVLFG